MRKLLLLLLTVISVSVSAQYQPSGSKVRYVNGIGLGTKSDAAFGTADSLVLYTKLDSTLMFKYKGTARALAYAGSSSIGSQIHDSLYAVYQLKAGTSAGVRIVSNAGTYIALFGAGGGSGTTLYGGLNGVTGNFSDSIIASKLIIQSGSTRLSSFHSDYQTNTFAGLGSGLLNTPIATTQGRQNSFYGALSGRNNTTGYATDNFGYSSGISQTTGGPNVNMGYQTGYTCDTCRYNVNLGTDAGYNNRVNNQIFIGFHAGKSISGSNQITGERNIVLSVEGAANLTSGYENTILGDRAAWSITTGYRNLMSGVASGYYNTTGYRNVFLGGEAGFKNADGYENLFGGYRAGYNGVSATSNTGLGSYALFSNVSGGGHTALGYNAGFYLTGGFYSTFIGFNSGNNASQKVDANYSIAIGEGSYTTKSNQAVFGNASDITETLLRGKVLVNTETNNNVDILQLNGSVISTQYKLSALNTAPSSASDTGTLGEIRIDANYIYICTATNTWKRVAISTW